MTGFGWEPIGEPREVTVDVLTDAYRVTGTLRTPFRRVAEMLNQLPGTHLTVERATVSEHGNPTGTLAAPSVVVPTEAILVMSASGVEDGGRGEMRIQKRPVKAQLGIPPLRVTGTIHVPVGSRPIDGLLNVTDRFVAMTDVEIACAPHPELARTAAVLAVRRDRASVILVADDERPDELLADVIDERTAESWLRAPDPGG